MTAGRDGASPIGVGVDRKIGGDEVEGFPVGGANEVGIAGALFAEIADQYGAGLVERGPVAAVGTEGEADLFAVAYFSPVKVTKRKPAGAAKVERAASTAARIGRSRRRRFMAGPGRRGW